MCGADELFVASEVRAWQWRKIMRLYYIHIAHTICTWVHVKYTNINLKLQINLRNTPLKYILQKKKVKWSRYRPGVAQRMGRDIALLFHDRGTRRFEWSAARPGRTLPPGKTRYTLYRRLGGFQGRSGRAENFFLTGIRSRTVHPVVGRYTDWATRPIKHILYI